jgi:hypothetical protein
VTGPASVDCATLLPVGSVPPGLMSRRAKANASRDRRLAPALAPGVDGDDDDAHAEGCR